MSSLGEVRADLATALQGLGFTPYAFEVTSPHLPAAIVKSPTEIEYHVNYEGACRIVVPVTLVVARVDDKDAHTRLNAAVSFGTVGSIVSALEAASGSWLALKANRAEDFRQIPVGDAQALAVDIELELIA